MPELPEIRIMRDYINRMCDGKTFFRVRKSELTKNDLKGIPSLTDKDGPSNPFRNSTFGIKAKSRGKEISLQLDIRLNISKDKEQDLLSQHFIDFNMGMTGHWEYVDTGDEPEHSHLMFDADNGCTLCLVDPRRFAKWKSTPHPFQDPMKRDDDLFGVFEKMWVQNNQIVIPQTQVINGVKHTNVINGIPLPRVTAPMGVGKSKRQWATVSSNKSKLPVIRYVCRRGPDPIEEEVVFAYHIFKAMGIVGGYEDLQDLYFIDAETLLKRYQGKFDKSLGNVKRDPVFEKPICEVMLDQRYFNGIGNYLRAEILDRADIDPMMPAAEAIVRSITSTIDKNKSIISLCKNVPLEAEAMGGAEIFTWKNPNGSNHGQFLTWLQCYGRKYSFIDGKGRRMWTDKKYIVEAMKNTI